MNFANGYQRLSSFLYFLAAKKSQKLQVHYHAFETGGATTINRALLEPLLHERSKERFLSVRDVQREQAEFNQVAGKPPPCLEPVNKKPRAV
jgi:hypothetical protein